VVDDVAREDVCILMPAVFTDCEDCGTEHLGDRCGLTFLERMRSVKVHESVTASRTKRDYFDDEPLREVFGDDKADRREKFLDETQGRGALQRDGKGGFYTKGADGPQPISPQEIEDIYLGPERDYDPARDDAPADEGYTEYITGPD
jgi:hypothetical protein